MLFSCAEPNRWITYMKIATFDLIRCSRIDLEQQRQSHYATLEQLQIKHCSIHVQNQMHKVRFSTFCFKMRQGMHIRVKFFYGAKNNKKSSKMASCMKNISECVSCFNETKYVCLSCGIPVCNIFGKPELDEETRGWIENRSVGYCKKCLIISKPVEACEQKKAT